MARTSRRLQASIAQRAALLCAAGLVSVGAAPAAAAGPGDVLGAVSEATGPVVGGTLDAAGSAVVPVAPAETGPAGMSAAVGAVSASEVAPATDAAPATGVQPSPTPSDSDATAAPGGETPRGAATEAPRTPTGEAASASGGEALGPAPSQSSAPSPSIGDAVGGAPDGVERTLETQTAPAGEDGGAGKGPAPLARTRAPALAPVEPLAQTLTPVLAPVEPLAGGLASLGRGAAPLLAPLDPLLGQASPLLDSAGFLLDPHASGPDGPAGWPTAGDPARGTPTPQAGSGGAAQAPGRPAAPPVGTLVPETQPLAFVPGLLPLHRAGPFSPDALRGAGLLPRDGAPGPFAPAATALTSPASMPTAPAAAFEAGGRAVTPAPRKAHVPLSPAGGAAAAASGGFSSTPFLALLVLLALAAPTLLRRLEAVPAFLRPTLFVCALERPG